MKIKSAQTQRADHILVHRVDYRGGCNPKFFWEAHPLMHMYG
jgi:hypothetical protein